MNNKTLLPFNETSALKEKDAAYRSFIGRRSDVVDIDPMTCETKLLPYLAQVHQVLYWDSQWSEDVKRKVINSARDVHRHIGTRWALELVLEVTGLSDEVEHADIHEGLNLKYADGKYIADGIYYAGGGPWSEYVVYVYKAISIAMAKKAKKMIEVFTPIRTKLNALVYAKALMADGQYVANGAYTAGVIGVGNV